MIQPLRHFRRLLYRAFIFCALLLGIATISRATHVIGGELNYQYTGTGNQYLVKLTIYGDCSGGAFSNLQGSVFTIQAYHGSSTSIATQGTTTAFGAGTEVTPVCAAQANNTRCSNPSSTIPGVKVFTATTTLTLAPASDWRIAFSGNNAGLARSAAIGNLTNASGTTIYLETTLNNSTGPNSSPVFGYNAPPYFCINTSTTYNPQTTDPNGDVLSYQLMAAQDGLYIGTSVAYNSGYTPVQPLATSGGTTLNATNGQMSFTANNTQTSCVVYKVTETRNGVVVGTSMREINFVILNCTNNPPAGNPTTIVNGGLQNGNTITTCQAGTLSFHILPTDPQNNNITMTASNLPPGATFTVVGNGGAAPNGTFSWNTATATPGTYNFFINYSDDACPLSYSQTIAYTVNVIGGRLYVNGAVPVTGNGSSWTSPFKTVNEALDAANITACTPQEIWVAAGTYYPTINSTTVTASRDSSFRVLRNGIKMYGGFFGNETLLSQRNVATNLTTLSGDIGTANDSTDNVYHVVTIVAKTTATIDTSTRVDGFTIRDGYAQGGSGNFVTNTQNIDRTYAGGIYIGGTGAGNGCSPSIANCTITRNTANYGGGSFINAGSGGTSAPLFTNTGIIVNISATGGGGVYVTTDATGGSATPTFRNCSLSANTTGANGAGLSGTAASPATGTVTIYGCTLDNNIQTATTASSGSALFFTSNMSAVIRASSFSNNVAANFGGALEALNMQNLTVDSSTFIHNTTNNTGGTGGALDITGALNATITNSVFTGNKSGYGGGVEHESATPITITNCTFQSDSAANYGGAMRNAGAGAPTVSNSRFLTNYGAGGGGAFDNTGNNVLTVINSVFSGNKGVNLGGVINNNNGSSIFTNCVLEGNSSTSTAGNGGVAHVNAGTTITFNDCTLFNNTAASTAAPNSNAIGIDATATANLNNTIVWGAAANQIQVTGTLNKAYSDVKGIAAAGTNLSIDPSFVNPASPIGADGVWATADDGLELAPCSPLLNTGSNALIPAGITTDITGATRIQLTTVDMGAYEAPAAGSILYVNGAVATTGTGFTWGTAFKTVTEALNYANRIPCIDTIWVKAGTYYPMINSTTVAASRDSSFRILRNGIRLYGGFNGTETAFAQRNVANNVTILSGDIGVLNDSTDNARHVMTILASVANPMDTTTIVNGFTITKGNADGGTNFAYNGLTTNSTDGGGILCAVNATGAVANALIDSCIFTANYAGVGAGMYCGAYSNGTSSPTVRNCLFIQNNAGGSAGLHSRAAGSLGLVNPTILNCRFISNTSGSGGALGALSSSGAPSGSTVTNCIFSANKATSAGGVFHSYGGVVNFTAINSVFTDNISPSGSVIDLQSGTTATFNNSTIYNSVAATGAAIVNAGTVNLNNSIVWGTSATQITGAGTLNAAYSDIRGIAAAGTNLSVDPSFIYSGNPVGADARWATADDGLRLAPCSPLKNVGSNALIPTGITTDIAGAARIQQTTVDMGAYESSVSGSRVYVDGTIAASGTGFTWGTAFKTVTEALTLANNAPCVDTIWVRAGTYYPTTAAGAATTNRDSSLRILRNGIKLFGGFNGTEILFSQRNVTTNVTILSGDIGAANDSTDNVYHVITIVPAPSTTVDTTTRIDGFTITRGNGFGASGSFTINGGNFNRQDGGGIYNYAINTTIESSPAIANCIFTKNAANFGGAIYNGAYAANGKASPRIASCTFTTNSANGDGGALYNNGTSGGISSPVVTNCTFTANTAGGFGGAIVNNGTATSTPQYAACIFSGNYVTNAGGGGGIVSTGGVVVNIRNSVFAGNTAVNAAGTVGSGGAYQHNGAGATSTLTNCVFVNNAANGTGDDGGGAIMNYSGLITLNDCTLYNNTTASTIKPDANAISTTAGNTTVLNNTIVWGTAAQQVVNLGTATNNYSDIRGVAAAGTNISADPQFINPSNPIGADAIWGTTDDGLRLTPCSPAINLGSNALIPAGVTTDFANTARIQNTTVDMGAYEMPYNSTGLPSTTIAMSPANPVCATTSVTFTATTVAPGAGPSYQWYKNNVAIAGATTTTYTASSWVNGDVIAVVHTNFDCNLKDTASTILVVTPGPATPGTISGATPVCAGTANTYSILPVTGATSYTWTATGTGWTSTPSTTTSFNTTAGTANGTINVTASNACGTSGASTLAVVVNPITTPTVSITSSTGTAICSGNSVTFTATAVNAGTTPSYQWKKNGGNVGLNQSTYVDAGLVNGDQISVVVTSNAPCATVPTATSNVITMVVTSTPVAPGTITGAATPCSGTSQTYSIIAIPAATTYTWAVPTGWTITAGTGTTSITVTVSNTAGNVTVSAGNGCGTSAVATKAVTPIISPAQPGTITGATATCSTISQTYSIAAVTNATTYTWTVPTGWVITAGQGTTSLTVTPSAGSGNITVTAGNGCATSSAATLAVTSTATPATPGAITGTTPVCAGSSQTYSITAVTNATAYNWTTPTGWSGTATTATPSETVLVGTAGGNVTVTASNYCGTSAAATLAVVVNANLTPSVSITNNSTANTICSGNSVTFTATPVNGGTAPTYQWKKNGINVTGTGATYTDAGLVNGDAISVVLTSNSPCVTTATATSATTIITVNSIPVAPATLTGASTICGGTTNTYTASPVGNATDYAWTAPTGWTSTPSTTTSFTTTANNSSGTITVSAHNSCGFSPITSLAVAVTAPLTPSVTIAANPGTAVCAGSSVTFTATPTNGGTTPAYQWKVNGTNVATGATYTTSTLANGDVVTAVLTTSLPCYTALTATSNALTMQVTSIPAQPGAISGATALCNGVAQQYSVTAVAGATNYTWTLPAGWSGSNVGPSILATPNGSGGTITVTANNQCGPSSPASLAVNVTSIPAQPGAISGPVTPCANTTQTYSVPAVSGATTYNWTLPAGWSGASSTATITVTTGAGAGTISVTAANGCGPSTAQTLAVAPISIPAAPATITGNATPCSGSAQVYSITAVAGATSYTWTGPSGWTGASTTASITYTTTATGGTVQVRANGVCGSSAFTSLSVNPILTLTPSVTVSTPSTTICQNAGATFTATPTGGGASPSYQWKKNGTNVGTNSPFYTDLYLVNGDVITVVLTSNAPCVTSSTATSTAMTLVVTPTAIPGISINTVPPIILCAGTPLIFSTTTTGGGTNPTYQWYKNGAPIPGVTTPAYNGTGFANGDTISVLLTSNAVCRLMDTIRSNKVGLTVQPNLTPTVLVTASPGTTVAIGTVVTFTATITDGGTAPAYQWYKNGTAIAFATNATYSTSGLHDGDLITVRLTSSAPCANPNILTSTPLRMNISTGVNTVTGTGWTGTISLYPNPNTGHFTVSADWGSGHSGERVRLELVNALGQTVYGSELVPNAAKWSVDVWLNEGIANGLYMFRLKSAADGSGVVKPVMIQR